MTEKIRKILSLVLALMLATFVFASSFAETADDPDDGDDLVSFEDDYNGYVAADVIKEHTPAMTSELIHADDSKYDQKAENEQTAVAETAAEDLSCFRNPGYCPDCPGAADCLAGFLCHPEILHHRSQPDLLVSGLPDPDLFPLPGVMAERIYFRSDLRRSVPVSDYHDL